MTSPSEQTGDRSVVRRRLVETAALLLHEEGPDALSARRIASAAGTSTMAVYTHFGGMPALVREIVAEGFTRLDEHQAAVPQTDDPVADLLNLSMAYRDNAIQNPHLYAVMFGATSLKGFQLTEADMAIGLNAFGTLTDFISRAMESGSLRQEKPARVAAQMWTAMHGYVMLELAGLHLPPDNPVEDVMRPLLATLLAGLSAEK
ncbi:MAG: TetR/AcrR family transcriptional regulator [Marmoricola sp.]